LRTPFLIGSLVLGLAAWFLPSRSPVVSALGGHPIPGVSLEHPIGYLILAPALGTLDYLTVLTVPQHIMVFVGLFGGYAVWRLFRRRTRRPVLARAGIELGALLGYVLALAAFYAAGALAYRPMARLVVDDPDIVVVDFHSHTQASHDGRWDFTLERNRAWHRGAGTHVAFLADHDSVAPAVRALADNPRRAGDDTVLLPGREVVYAGQHVVALGLVDPRVGEGSWVPDPDAPPAPHGIEGDADPVRWCLDWPVLIQTIPNRLDRVPVPACSGRGAGVDAIELIDGDPRGLLQGERERERILAIADSLGLALVSSSNLHGWGSTATGWNLMRIPGWRDMTPEEVGRRIEGMVRHEGRTAVEVVAYRRPADAGAGAGAAAVTLAAVSLPVHFFAQRTPAERLAWLVWAILVFGTGSAIARRRSQRAEPGRVGN